MRFRLEIKNVQHIVRFVLRLDLSQKKLTCLVGRNGIGKTTLVKGSPNPIPFRYAIANCSARNCFERQRNPLFVG